MTEHPPAPEHERHKLDKAFVGGIAWTAAAKWLSQLVSWPSVLVCAHYLSKSDFGLVEMAGFYFIVTNIMAEFGVGMAVLQMRELDEEIVAQLNSVAILLGCAGFAVSIAAASLIAGFFRAPELHRLVIVSSTSFILISVEAVPLSLLQRDMDYKKLSVGESLQALVTSCVAVVCAISGFAYWSLIVGSLVGRAANVALAVYWRPVPLRLPNWKQSAVPLRFGMAVAAQRVLGSISSLSDAMVIGRVLGPASLGAFRLASNLATTPSEKIGTLIMRVTGPLFARVQSDRALMRRYFLIFSETLALSLFPLLLGLATVAPETVRMLLPSEKGWSEAVSPLRWLAVYMVVRTTSYLMNQLLTTLRFAKFGMWLSVVNFTIMPVAFYFAARYYGVGAVAIAWLAMSPVALAPAMIRVLRTIECSAWEYLRSLLPALGGSLAMVLAVAGFRASLHLDGWRAGAQVGAEAAVGGVVYCGLLWAFHRARIMQYVRFFLQLRNKPAADAAVPA